MHPKSSGDGRSLALCPRSAYVFGREGTFRVSYNPRQEESLKAGLVQSSQGQFKLKVIAKTHDVLTSLLQRFSPFTFTLNRFLPFMSWVRRSISVWEFNFFKCFLAQMFSSNGACLAYKEALNTYLLKNIGHCCSRFSQDISLTCLSYLPAQGPMACWQLHRVLLGGQ